MSQRITVKSIITKPTKKEGTNITTIEDETGAKMSTFNDAALEKVHAGDVLEVEIAIEGKYTNITSWKLIESKPIPEAPKPVPPPTDWTEKDRITRVSIERQVALKCAAEVRREQNDQTIVATAEAFYRFLSGEQTKTAIASAEKPPAPAKDSLTVIFGPQKDASPKTDGVAGRKFANMGEFRKAAAELGFRTEMSISSALEKPLGTIGDLDKAYQDLLVLKGKTPLT